MSRLTPIIIGAAALTIGWQLMVPPVVGLANNGDFGKLLGNFGLGTPWEHEHMFADTMYDFDSRYRWRPAFLHRATAFEQAPGRRLSADGGELETPVAAMGNVTKRSQSCGPPAVVRWRAKPGGGVRRGPGGPPHTAQGRVWAGVTKRSQSRGRWAGRGPAPLVRVAVGRSGGVFGIGGARRGLCRTSGGWSSRSELCSRGWRRGLLE